MSKRKSRNNDLQNSTQKTKEKAIGTPLNTQVLRKGRESIPHM
jgi:hypothetical protein